jgi:hypothetical protein
MNPNFPITIAREESKSLEMIRLRTEATKAKRPAFSRASDFALLLLPVLCGVAFTYLHDMGATPRTMAIAVGLFVVGLGASLAVLRGVEAVEAWEEQNPSWGA